jgi:protein-disulfide isomerase
VILLIHAPSLGIGAGIAAAIIIGVFFAMSGSTETVFKPEDIKPADTEKQEVEQEISLALFYENASPYIGDPNAPITIVEFGDYQCFYCNKFFHETEAQIHENYVNTGKVKMIFKDFIIIGQDSVTAAHAAHCANEQGKFWEYHDTLYNNWNGENNGWASAENQLRFAQGVGLNMTKFSECTASNKYRELIQSSTEDAQTLGLTGTPGFFVIGPNNKIVKIPGAQPYDVFVNVLESAEIKS